MKIFRSYSSRETARFGKDFAAKLFLKSPVRAPRQAAILALEGDLGAGKTTFAQGFARGLGIRRRTASPTFIIMRRFAIPAGSGRHTGQGKFKVFYHIDAYRIKKNDPLDALGIKEVLEDPSNIVLVEWPEKIKKILPAKITWLKFGHGGKENERIITKKVMIRR